MDPKLNWKPCRVGKSNKDSNILAVAFFINADQIRQYKSQSTAIKLLHKDKLHGVIFLATCKSSYSDIGRCYFKCSGWKIVSVIYIALNCKKCDEICWQEIILVVCSDYCLDKFGIALTIDLFNTVYSVE